MKDRGLQGYKRAVIAAQLAGTIMLDDRQAGLRFFLGGEISGPGAAGRSIEQIARKITASYGQGDSVELNEATFKKFIQNFEANVYGQEIYVDRAHNPNDGVMGKVERIFTDAAGDRLLMEMSWTEAGVKTFTQDGFKYFSIEYHPNYQDRETKKVHGPTLFGVAMTPRPFIKGMQPSAGPGRLYLSEGRSVYVPDYLNLPQGESMNKFLRKLKAALEAKKLSAAVIGVLVAQAKHAAEAKKLSDDNETEIEDLLKHYEAVAKTLAEDPSNLEPTQRQPPAAKTLSEEDVANIVTRTLAEHEANSKKQAEAEASNRRLFTDAVDEAKGLSDEIKQTLKEQAQGISAGMTADQVKKFAAASIELGNKMEVERQKSTLGMPVVGPTGVVTGVTLMEGGNGSKLHALMREKLLLTDHASSLTLPEEKTLSSFAKKVLAIFDKIHAPRIEAEVKLLANDGSTNIADGQFPVAAQRQVIVELLADLKVMAIVQALTDPAATATTQVPYEVRNISTIKNGAIVYEGQGIPRAGVTQLMDTAYITPRKLAMLVSNEMIHFSRAALINWDAWGRNIASNARLMKDLVAVAIMREIQRASDAYGAASITSEAITSQVNGTRKLFKTAQFPIVRPHQVRDLQGNAVGSASNPITVSLNGSAIQEYDGTGTQSAGNYYQITDYNLGLFQIVNKDGVVQTPADETPLTISYSYATNVDKFDITVPGGTDYDVHLNTLLNKVGRRKAMLQQQRFVNPNFALCSSTLHNMLTEAKQFEANSQKEGTGLNSEGDLERVKGIPFFGTNQPGSDLGDSRIILGERGTLTYTVVKPFATGTPFEAVDSQGRPTGEKIAYGEEYSSLHVPVPLRNRLTSIIVYDATARTAI